MKFYEFYVGVAVAIEGSQVDASIRQTRDGVATLDPNFLDRWLDGATQGWGGDQEVGFGKINPISNEIEQPGELQFLDYFENYIEFSDGKIDQELISANYGCQFAGFVNETEHSEGDKLLEAILLHVFEFTISCAGKDKETAAKLLRSRISEYFFIYIDDEPMEIEYFAIAGFTPPLGADIPICKGCLFVIDANQRFCSECGAKV